VVMSSISALRLELLTLLALGLALALMCCLLMAMTGAWLAAEPGCRRDRRLAVLVLLAVPSLAGASAIVVVLVLIWGGV